MTTASEVLGYVRAARPVAHGMMAVPLLWGQALAWAVTREFHWQWFLLVHLFGALYQVYVLYLNDYADEALDRLNHTYWLSGGSRVLPEGQLQARQLFHGALVAMVGIGLVTLIAAFAGRPEVFVLMALALFLGWSYSLHPLCSSYRGFGELHQGLTCGCLLPLLAFYLQTGTWDGFPWLLLIPTLLLFYAANIVTALPDTPADLQGGKRTYPVRYGESRARRDAVLLFAAAYSGAWAISASWVASLWMALAVSGPALGALVYVCLTGLVRTGNIENRAACKRFVLVNTLGQAWFLSGWTVLLFLIAKPPT